MDAEKERANFEVVAFCSAYPTSRRTEDGIETSYVSPLTEVAWQAWLARAKLDKMPPLIRVPEVPLVENTGRERQA